jgi:hypothetical protein
MDRTAVTDIKRIVKIDGSGANMSQRGSILARDKTQSHRLHELSCIISHTDPMTGNDVMGVRGHPFLVDGILTVYFESEQTRQDYQDMLFNHPVPRLGGTPTAEDDRGG